MKEKDMHLPVWVCGLGIIFLVAAVVCMAIVSISPLICITAAVICLCLGISAVLCWRNQWAEVIDDDEFIYSTMFGNKNKYRFSEITDFRQNNDSMTLFLGKNKIHIESCAIISDRFANLVNQALGRDDNEFKMIKGARFDKQCEMKEGFCFSGDNSIIANVSEEKIGDVIAHFTEAQNEPLFFVLELPTNAKEEEKLRKSDEDALHIDVYCIYGCTREKIASLMEEYGELLINDGVSSFGIGCNESGDEIMVNKFNCITIYSKDIHRYDDFYFAHDIYQDDNLKTAWEYFSEQVPGISERYEYNGKTVFDLPQELHEFGMYKVETREE